MTPYPFAEFPQWVDMGPDQDYAAPTGDLVSLLKKRMGKKSPGSMGADLGGVLGEGGSGTPLKMPSSEGVNSL